MVRAAVKERARLRQCGDEVLGPDDPADTPPGETPVLVRALYQRMNTRRVGLLTFVRPSTITTGSCSPVRHGLVRVRCEGARIPGSHPE